MNIEKINLREKIGYGLGDAASSMFWKMFGMYLLFFYTDVFGISAKAAGIMLLATRVFDIITDPLVGVMADRTESKWGKFRPYILFTAVPFALVGVLTFTTPDISTGNKLIYAYITYSAMMLVYTLINVPYASMLGVISANPKTRTELSSYRMIFAFGGSMIALLLAEPLSNFFSNHNGSNNQAFGWQMTMVVFGIIAVIFFFACFSWTKERVKPIKESKNTFKEDLTDLWHNKAWWILLGAGIAALLFNSIRDGVAIYYFKYCVINPESVRIGILDMALPLSTLYLVLGQAANILGILMVTNVANRIGKKKTYLSAMAIAGVLSVIFYFVGYNDIGLIMLLQVLISMCAGSIFPLLWSMYADVADYSEFKTGRRATGLIFSSSSGSQKIGWAVGGFITAWLLDSFGFIPNQLQSVETQSGIKMMMSILPAMGALLSVIVIFIYPLTKEKLEEVTAALKNKRESL